MPGIANLDADGFCNRVLRFDASYIADWQSWMDTLQGERDVAIHFGRVLRRWQACRPNRMRRTKGEMAHDPPYLEDLIAAANPSVRALRGFDLRLQDSFTRQAQEALEELWEIFQNLSYQGRARDGLAGAVGISKAVMLLTEGRVGPAFDSEVRGQLGVPMLANAGEWIQALQVASRDIQSFEAANRCTLHHAAPDLCAVLHSGRIYDMALGPG